MDQSRRRARPENRAGQRGLGLVETLAAVAILGTAIVTFVAALSAGSLAVNEQGNEVVAQRLVQTQLEYTKSVTYNGTATTYPTVAAPAGYDITVKVTSVPNTDNQIQKITVTVARGGQDLLSAAEYKMDR